MAIRKKKDSNVPKDEASKGGGSAASRAGRYLEGPVARDFSSPEKAGYRCITQTPGCEPTGFTGQCTKQPEVGGAWPCITALPLCHAEPTGFTGQCTEHPWPNPTRYAGCTVLHCPTNDLTHQPHICRVVEAGIRGGADAQGAAAEEKALPVTAAPGCGYTQTWGLCETHLLGCGWTKQGGLCQPSVQNPCIPPTETPGCNPQVGAFAGRPGTFVDACTHPFGCNTRFGGCTAAGEPCRTIGIGSGCGTESGPRCTLPAGDCTFFNCPTRICFGAGEFAARAALPHTAATVCTQSGPCHTYPNGDCTFFNCPTSFDPQCPSAIDACPTRFRCPTPNTQCTMGGLECRTHQAPHCPTHDPCCEPTRGIACTQFPPQCPVETNPILDCTFGCTQFGANCPQQTVDLACQQVGAAAAAFPGRIAPTPATRCFWCPPPTFNIACTPVAAAPAVAGGGQEQAGAAGRAAISAFNCPTPATYCFWCPPATFSGDCGGTIAFAQRGGGGLGAAAAPSGAATVCTQFGRQCPSAVDACPTRICTPATVCTQTGPQCRTYPNGDCTFFNCPTQFDAQCPSAVDACPTRLCGGGQEQVGAAAGRFAISSFNCPTPATFCFWCPPATFSGDCGGTIAFAQRGGGGLGAAAAPSGAATVCTQLGPQCHTYPNGDCTFFGCGPGGGGGQTATVCTQFSHQCQSAVDGCPTRLCGGGGGEQLGAAPGAWPTPQTRCFVCDPIAGTVAARPRVGWPQQTNNPIWCNPHSGLPFDCPFPSLFFVCTAVQCGIGRFSR